MNFTDETAIKKLISKLKTLGCTDQGITGFLCNVYAESHWDHRNAENKYMTQFGITDEDYIRMVDANSWARPDNGKKFWEDRIGFGWVQFTSNGRKFSLFKKMCDMGTSIGDEDIQIECIADELKGSYKNVLNVLTDPDKTIDDCARYVMVYYEGCANQSEANKQKRSGYGDEIFEHFFGGHMRRNFTKREHKPCATDPYIAYFNNGNNNGLSHNINGNGPDPEANVLKNCTGYANGRFNEIISEMTGEFGMRYQLTTDAERFITQAKNQGLKISQYPHKGAIIVWKKGEIGHSDGAGHCEVVEDVVDYNKIYNSRSGWTSPVFGNILRTNSNKNWGKTSPYTFLGFVLNPALDNNPFPIPTETLKKGMKTDSVKWLQWELQMRGYTIDIDGSFGAKTEKIVKQYQSENLDKDGVALEVDGKCGGKTRRSLL